MFNIVRLDWDSDFFGLEVGKLNYASDIVLDKELFQKKALKFNLVYVFSEHIITSNFLALVDIKVVFKGKIEKTPYNINLNIQEFDAKIHDLDQLVQLCLESGIHSRFRLDKNFVNNEYEKLYKHWLNKSLSKELAFKTLVYFENNEVLGFVTIGVKELDTSEIGLIAVDKKARGRSIASDLISAVNEISLNLSFKYIQVVTQKNNIPAVNLYTKSGFDELSSTYIYHYWNTIGTNDPF